MSGVSADPVEVTDLARVADRISFLYVERSSVSRQDNSLTVSTVSQTVRVPSAMVACVLLGPGTVVTHQGVSLMADAGVSAVWCGEEGVRFYAAGSSLAHSSRYLERQAELATHRLRRLEVARQMYALRFPGEDVSSLTMQQLRGREGARVRAVYREEAARWGIDWRGRDYVAGKPWLGDPANQALSAANSALYGVVHSAILALGCSPALGFVHTGHHRAFVYDVADLYKAEITIPAAFEVAAHSAKPSSDVRRLVRDRLHGAHLLPRVCRDVRNLLFPESDEAGDLEGDVVYLWDEAGDVVPGGTAYGGSGEPA